jgi:hypothetical protein
MKKKLKKKKKLTTLQNAERFYQQLAYDTFGKEEAKGVKIMAMADTIGVSPRYAAKRDHIWDGTTYDTLSFNKRDIGIADTLDRKAEELILEKVKQINRMRGFIPDSERIEPAPKPLGNTRVGEIYGINNICAVLRTLGREGMSLYQARRLMKHFNIEIVDRTIRGQIWCGKQNGEYGKYAELTEKQIDKLFVIAGEDE